MYEMSTDGAVELGFEAIQGHDGRTKRDQERKKQMKKLIFYRAPPNALWSWWGQLAAPTVTRGLCYTHRFTASSISFPYSSVWYASAVVTLLSVGDILTVTGRFGFGVSNSCQTRLSFLGAGTCLRLF